jgi:hypothetical protein
MKERLLKNAKILLLALYLFLIANSTLAAERALEVNYPSAGGSAPTTTGVSFPEYVIYIYKFIITAAGVIAFGVLVLAGIRFLTSAGKPENLTKARDQIVSAFWGIILLLASYLILSTINPQLVLFNLPGISLPQISPAPQPIAELPTSDLLRRLKTMAEAIKVIPDKIKENATEIKLLTGDDKCNCDRTRSLCLCNGGAPGSSCEAKWCYAGPDMGNDPNLCGGEYSKGAHPCPDIIRIKALQKEIVDWRDVLLYYKTRALAEAEDLNRNITLVLDKKIAFYNELISRLRTMGTIPLEAISRAEKDLQKIQEEKQYKTQLIQKLKDLAAALAKVELPTTEIAKLPDRCLSDINLATTLAEAGAPATKIAKCKPSCLAGGKYGCHDKLCGCQPDKCSGGNPCPVEEIKKQVSKINPLPGEIMGACDQIINIINQIK